MHKIKKNTIFRLLFIVFFCALVMAIILFNIYGNKVNKDVFTLTNEKLDKIIYQFFNDLITNDVINKETVNDILKIDKNKEGEILAVNYDLEKTYTILTDVAGILKKGLEDLENGQIDVLEYDKYLESSPSGLILNVPFFIHSQNVFLNNLGPMIPVMINFNDTLITNVKTKVTNYGFNNALLELYITVEMQKLIITPLKKNNSKFNYDILIASLVVNGSVPEFYGSSYEAFSSILLLPNKI